MPQRKWGEFPHGFCRLGQSYSLVTERRSLLPASDAPIKFFRWTGFRPSGPPADPAGKEMIAFLTASDEIGV